MSDKKHENVQVEQELTKAAEPSMPDRRSFLGKLGMGAAAVAAVTVPGTASAQCADPAESVRGLVTNFNFNLRDGHKLKPEQLEQIKYEVHQAIDNVILKEILGRRLQEFGVASFGDAIAAHTKFSAHGNFSKSSAY